MTPPQDNPLIKALQNTALYDHPVERFELIETHISWVLLTGPYAYKIKKPVDLGFLDFSSLEKRRFYCHEELRLNRRLAPQLYLAVLAITGSLSMPVLSGPGHALEYAVKMVQFDQDQQWDRLLARKALTIEEIGRLARIIATFHQSADCAPADSDFGAADAVWQPVTKNFSQLQPLLLQESDRRLLDPLQQWFKDMRRQLRPLFAGRKSNDHIRECHGDLHLANIARYRDQPVVFDCLEFNERLRWIDAISDAAFLVMDLDSHGQTALATRFLNNYLHYSGDYEALPLLPFYLAYRAMVRAKVAAIRRQQQDRNSTAGRQAMAECRHYLNLAVQYTQDKTPALIITHGLSGSGKTSIAQLLYEKTGAIRIRSDVERKRLYGLPLEGAYEKMDAAGLYSAEMSDATYGRLSDLTRCAISGGFTVIVDAAFLQRSRRVHFHALAASLKVPFIILHCQAPEALLRQWIRQRSRSGQDASDANIAVLEQQLNQQEPLTAAEQQHMICVETATSIDPDWLVDELKRLTGLHPAEPTTDEPSYL